ncbi:PduT-like ethanolamine utilization protein [Clostridium tetanomorphum]|uniref:BMC domain-containing protein n=1 Tax=Clostridium tetanomorphum TaxID=1553 RepID=A0A923IZP2_CLOTT|nr:BMC domain-containing protein [Clostridium tetanomorphum]KAJ52582.1 microcompartments protein [Clostridium tetanomorphum DSM 665]MBC2396864.1 BMC domain-containing protein [Clostridium tetanomorphum]MBP1863174.1 PduT-like ethanolamine utilization protein [Clostridium tetanomorphum]NRS84282.1 PduT-like ethanolamine utilization protein [Clostridium tetanomorphum]NRZ97496.1 PduT-like ethanolamine utilization protein [Clostridium tetanomorphum]
MIKTIGMIELRSIAKGIEATDFMVKASQVEVVFSRTVCPGKYIILISGDVAEVEEAINKGLSISENYVVDKLILPSIYNGLLDGIKGKIIILDFDSIGIMEFSNISSSIVAADISCKSGNVNLLRLRLGMGIGGKSYFIISGDVSSVKEALEAASHGINKKKLISKVLIPSPDKELFKNLI